MLTIVEQNAVENMVKRGLSNSEIKKTIGKKAKDVDLYIKQLTQSSQEAELNPLVRSGALARLAKAGINGSQATDLMSRTLKKIENAKTLTVEELYNSCIAMLGARELIRTTSDGGNPGVAVMTGEAANTPSRETTLSRKAAPAIFHPKTGTMEGEV